MDVFIKYIFLVVFGMSVLSSCRDEFQLNERSPLEFSIDTLTFDTVFTTIGSATAKLLVYNRSRDEINIDELKLAGGAASPFRINVDGRRNAEHHFRDITIRGRDSMFIFVEVTIDPLRADAPVLQLDSIVFSTNNLQQRVLLEAFGQDMIPLNNKTLTINTTLSAGKPYLIRGNLTVDSARTLTLTAGARLFFHHNANLVVYGNLEVDGTFQQPVIMRGSRMDKIQFTTPIPYHHVAGQWGGVYLLSRNGNHRLNHLQLSSGQVGLYFYNSDRRFRPRLEINSSRIHNSLFYNLVAINGDLLVTNSEISNSSGYTVYLNGGNHRFIHCTIVNYFNSGTSQPVSRARQPAVFLMNLNRSLPMTTHFQNSVIAGTLEKELTIASRQPHLFRGKFSNSYIQMPSDTSKKFVNIRFTQARDTLFQNIRYNIVENLYFDFMPDSISPLRGLSDPAISIQFPLDLHGRSRLKDGQPDAGAYEWYPTGE